MLCKNLYIIILLNKIKNDKIILDQIIALFIVDPQKTSTSTFACVWK